MLQAEELAKTITEELRERYEMEELSFIILDEIKQLITDTINDAMHQARPFIEVSCRLREGGEVYAVREFGEVDLDRHEFYIGVDRVTGRLYDVVVKRDGNQS